ncbi:MAG: T9SS type A sorting domain-containing protein [Ignavibacteria bacterium]
MKKVLTIFAIFCICNSLAYSQITAPSNLRCETEHPFYVKVRWDDNSNNESGFFVERATNLDSADWEIAGRVSQNMRIFNDYWITYGQKYFYRSFAYNNSGFSGYSNIDSVIALGDTTNLPGKPTNLRVTNTTMTSISMIWDDNSNNEFGFIIARKKPGDIFFEYIDTVQTDVLTYQDVGLTPDNLYVYKVCSYNGTGISDYSNSVSAVTKESTRITRHNLEIANNFFIGNNYPNPFNPVTNIKFAIPSRSFVKITIYNSQGSQQEILLNNFLSSGTYTISWNAGTFSSGVYFYGIEADGFKELRKMILIK